MNTEDFARRFGCSLQDVVFWNAYKSLYPVESIKIDFLGMVVWMHLSRYKYAPQEMRLSLEGPHTESVPEPVAKWALDAPPDLAEVQRLALGMLF